MIESKIKDEYSNIDIVNAYDELPLWAAPFGLKLLDKIEYKKNMKVLDIGCGVGFPSLEIAQRLGGSSKVYGMDLWRSALEQAKYKASVYDVKNMEFIFGNANEMPFEDNSFDMVVSNNGINNTGDEARSIAEAYRVLRTGGQFVFTVNLPGTMKEFYDIYKEVLIEKKLEFCQSRMDEHIFKHRKSIENLSEYISKAGFIIEEIDESSFNIRFSSGTALLEYHFIRLCFLKPWIDIVGQQFADVVFESIEDKLNISAEHQNGLKLTIPFVCFSCRKQ